VSMRDQLAKTLEKLGVSIDQAGEKWRDEIRAGFAETSDALAINGARVLPLDGRALALGNSGPCRVLGWSVRNNGAAPATLTLHDGRDAAADVTGTCVLAAGASHTSWFGPGGFAITDALFLEVAGGPLAGAVYLGPA